MINLTGKDILALAEMAGFEISERTRDEEDSLEVEISITLENGTLKDDDGKEQHYHHIAFYSEYPDEGGFGLGEIDK